MCLTGYLHSGYARSLAEFGTPVSLPRSGAWLLKREISGHADFDAMACYPLLACSDWAGLANDLEAVGSDLVSVAAVTDPFGHYSLTDLQQAFPDIVIHFKDHYVTDLTQPPERIMSPRRRGGAKAIMRKLDVEIHARPVRFLDQWMNLFNQTIQKFHITGIRAYSRASLAQQLALPGSFMSMARYQGEVVSAHIHLVHGDVAYAHLGAASPIAYTLSADHALYYAAIEYFAGKVRWLNWGGEVGIAKSNDSKLGSFKRQWSTDTRPVYFCGRIFDRRRYDQITRSEGFRSQSYFPAYRAGEFN
jgi:hypothetical protein